MQVVYFGEADAALTMFEDAGLPCPMHRNPTDHFLHMINEDFQVRIGLATQKRASLLATEDLLWLPRAVHMLQLTDVSSAQVEGDRDNMQKLVNQYEKTVKAGVEAKVGACGSQPLCTMHLHSAAPLATSRG